MKLSPSLLAFGFGLSSLAVSAQSVRAYFGTRGSEGIHTALFNEETGKLSESRKAAESNHSGFLAWSPKHQTLYATAALEDRKGGVAAYGAGEDGELTLKGIVSSEGSGACFVSVDASEQMVMVANYGSGSVAALKIGEDGALEKSTSFHQHEGSSVNERRQEGPHAHSIYPGPDHKFAYAPDLGTDEVVIYRMDPARSVLEPAGAGKMPPGSGPRHMKFSKDGKRAYVLSELTLTVVVFERNPDTGGLAQIQEVSVLPDGQSGERMSCSEILVSKDGRFVYTANRDVAGKGRDSLSVLSVDTLGELKRVQTVPAEVSIPRNIKLSPSGRWLLVAGQKKGGVPVFKVADDGCLSFSDHRMPLDGAMCIIFQ